MRTFAHAHANAGTWQEVTEACLSRLPAAPRATLGFLYVTEPLAPNLREMLEELKVRTGVGHWVGSVGLAINATGAEYYDQPAAAIMLADFPEDAFRVFGPIDARSETSFDKALQVEGQPAHFAVVHADPAAAGLPELITKCAHAVSSGFVVGGLSSSNAATVQIADGLVQGGVSGVALRADIPVLTRLTQGCSPIGTKHDITECRRNILIRLDGRPALDVFRADVGEVLARDLNRTAGYIFAGLPVSGSDRGDYLVRNIMGLDVNNGLIAVGEMLDPGGQIMFCRRDAQTARDDLDRMLQELKAELRGAPRGGLYYSCLGRGANLFGPHSEELRQVRDVLGDFPLVGFFANGEISHDRLYGYTGVLTLFP